MTWRQGHKDSLRSIADCVGYDLTHARTDVGYHKGVDGRGKRSTVRLGEWAELVIVTLDVHSAADDGSVSGVTQDNADAGVSGTWCSTVTRPRTERKRDRLEVDASEHRRATSQEETGEAERKVPEHMTRTGHAMPNAEVAELVA